MNIRNTLLITACILPSLTLHATQESAIINFQTLINEMCAIIPADANQDKTGTRASLIDVLKSAVDNEAYNFFNKAYQVDALHDLIEDTKDDIEKNIEQTASHCAEQYTTSLMDGLIRQSVGYLAFQREIATHENVVLQFTAPWCPPCQFFAPVLEQCAQDYAANVRIIKVDITQNTIMGIKIDSIPTFIFFKHGKEVYRQTGLNIEAVTKKHTNPNSDACKIETLQFLEEDFRLCIEHHLLS